MVHVYNAWLPPPVAERAATEEPATFHEVVSILQQTWEPLHPTSAYKTLKWISLLNNLLKGKSDLARDDLNAIAHIALDMILNSPENNLFIQVRWGSFLSSLLKKHHKKLTLSIDWRPFYELLYNLHFKRQHTYEGWALKKVHLDTMTSLVRHCRQFFPSSAAEEVWSQFRPAIQDFSHNSSQEAVGFMSLLLPTKGSKANGGSSLFTSDWLWECLTLWSGIQNCHFWDFQWSSLVGRFIKHQTLNTQFDMKPFLPTLFMRYLNVFEVPIGKETSMVPIQREVSNHFKVAFNGTSSTSLAKVVAKSIVFLLHPNGSAQNHLEVLIDFLEQYYHPSNGGSWTSSLEKLLRYIVLFFLKRLAKERKTGEKLNECPQKSYLLGATERIRFVKAVMHLIERGQYSKSGRLAGTAARAASSLAFVAPGEVLPVIASRFQAALDTVTATHQLESAVTTLALCSRAMLLASGKEHCDDSGIDSMMLDSTTSDALTEHSSDSHFDYKSLVADAMFRTLPGLDANDPPKTLATLQFYCSVLSSVEQSIGESTFLPMDWSLWIDEFLARVFVLLEHLDSTTGLSDSNSSDGLHLSSRTFLMQDQSLCTSLLELLFSRLSTPLFRQALKKILKFVLGTILPGAAAEVGFLCAVIVYAQPKDGVLNLLEPVLVSVISSLIDSPSTGFSGSDSIKSPASKATLSPGLETSVLYYLNILSVAVMYGGIAMLHCKELLKKAIACAFDAPSPKVNEAGNRLLSSLFGTLVLYFPLNQYKPSLSYPGMEGLELWISPSDNRFLTSLTGPSWHIAGSDEINYVKELIDSHIKDALCDLRNICEGHLHSNDAGTQKEHLRVVFLRLDGCLRGLRSCLPDFKEAPESGSLQNTKSIVPLSIVGQAGATIGDPELREEVAESIHEAYKFLLKERADDTSLLTLLIRIIDLTGNYGSLEYDEWANGRESWQAVSTSLCEPHVNYITNQHAPGRRRPQWLVFEKTSLHCTWRASQSKYRPLYKEKDSPIPHHVRLLSMDLLNLCLQKYDTIRISAGDSLKKMLKRFPPLIKDCIPLLTTSLKDSNAVEESALGACMVLSSRPVLRHLTQDWNSLTSFIFSILGSSHHASLKAQRAINELFISFLIRFGGVQREALSSSNLSESNQAQTCDLLISFLKEILDTTVSTVHWRYNLMGHGMLLTMASLLPPPIDISEIDAGLALRFSIAGHFLHNLKSELPPLRPISTVALLFLLGPSQHKAKKELIPTDISSVVERKGENSEKISLLMPILVDEAFCGSMVRSLALDHHYNEGQGRTGRSRGGLQHSSDFGLTAMMPSVSRGWPRTLSWDSTMKGECFSSRNAALFKRLLQECGSSFLEVLHSPLEDVVNDVDDRGNQCMAAEIMAGIVHSDVEYVSEAWDIWVEKLFYKALMQANVESVPEWAACIRYTVTGKGKIGQRSPHLRHKVLASLAQPLPSSSATSLIAKRLEFLLAATVELSSISLDKECIFQLGILGEVVKYITHSAPQVRESIGKLLCVLYSNLLQTSKYPQELQESEPQQESLSQVDGPSLQRVRLQLIDWEKFLVDGTLNAAAKIEGHGRVCTDDTSLVSVIASNVDGDEDESLRDAVRWMETVFHFAISGFKSGRAAHLVPMFVGIIHPLLSSQETSHKDMSALARSTIHLLKWQTFEGVYASQALSAILGAAADSNWRTRIASLAFLQIYMYRHIYILSAGEMASVWNCVESLLHDLQVEVREMASITLSGLMKGGGSQLISAFRDKILDVAMSLSKAKRQSSGGVKSQLTNGRSIAEIHGVVLGLTSCVLSAPYDIPRWVPKMILAMSKFSRQPAPIRSTVTKAISEFRRTHADTWAYDKLKFSEDELEVLSDLSFSTSYFV